MSIPIYLLLACFCASCGCSKKSLSLSSVGMIFQEICIISYMVQKYPISISPPGNINVYFPSHSLIFGMSSFNFCKKGISSWFDERKYFTSTFLANTSEFFISAAITEYTFNLFSKICSIDCHGYCSRRNFSKSVQVTSLTIIAPTSL